MRKVVSGVLGALSLYALVIGAGFMVGLFGASVVVGYSWLR